MESLVDRARKPRQDYCSGSPSPLTQRAAQMATETDMIHRVLTTFRVTE